MLTLENEHLLWCNTRAIKWWSYEGWKTSGEVFIPGVSNWGRTTVKVTNNRKAAAIREQIIVGETVATATGVLWAARWSPGADGVGSANDMCEGASASRRRALFRGNLSPRSYTGSRDPSLWSTPYSRSWAPLLQHHKWAHLQVQKLIPYELHSFEKFINKKICELYFEVETNIF